MGRIAIYECSFYALGEQIFGNLESTKICAANKCKPDFDIQAYHGDATANRCFETNKLKQRNLRTLSFY